MTNNIHEAMFELQGKLRGVKKDSANPHFKNRYASLEQVTDTIRVPMQECGLFWFQSPGRLIDGALEVTTRIIHASTGAEMGFTMQMPLAKKDPQGAGSAMTYAMRYSLMAALGLPPTDDDAETAIDRDNKRPEIVQEPKKTHPRNEEARQLFTFLQKDFRSIKDTDQLKSWWRDMAAYRAKLPVSWSENLKQEWVAHGLSLKSAEETIAAETGGKIVSDRYISNLEAGE